MQNDIDKALRQYIDAPLEVNIKGPYVIPSDRIFKQNSDTSVYAEDLYRNKPGNSCQSHVEVQKLSGWLPSSRGNIELNELFSALYRTDKIPESINGFVVNNFADDSPTLADFFLNRFTAISGKRGIGKTSALNYWLCSFGDRHFIQNKLVWFKIDASKLYQIPKENEKQPVRLKRHICDYIPLHVAADFIIYCGKMDNFSFERNCLFAEIADGTLFSAPDMAHTLTMACTKLASRIPFHERQIIQTNSLNIVEAIIKKADHTNQIIHDAADYALHRDDKEFRHHLETIYDVLTKELRLRGKKTILIIDGVDGIETIKPQEQYNDMIEHIAQLINCCHEPRGGDCKHRPGNKCYLDKTMNICTAVRPETLLDLDDAVEEFSYDQVSTPRIFPGKIYSFPIRSILDHKLSALKTSKQLDDLRTLINKTEKPCAANKKPPVQANIPKQTDSVATFIERYKKSFDVYRENIIKCVSEIYDAAVKTGFNPASDRLKQLTNDPSKDSENIIEELFFDKNIRAVIDNFLNTKLLTDYLNSNKDAKRDAERTKLLYMKYVLMNGRVMLDTQRTDRSTSPGKPIRRGECFPNVFWFDKNERTWGGFTGIRILQFLRRFRSQYPSALVLTVLKELFDLSDEHLWTTYRRLIEYGLIEVEKDSSSGNTKENYPDFVDISGKANITEKGKFYLDFSFIYAEWGYVFAIDTPMPRDLAEDISFFKVHMSHLDTASKEEFFDAFLTTIPTFARVVKHFHRIQMDRMATVLRNWSRTDFPLDDMIELRNAMALPDSFTEMIVRSVRIIIDQKYKRLRHLPRMNSQREDARAALDENIRSYLKQLSSVRGAHQPGGESSHQSRNGVAGDQTRTAVDPLRTLVIVMGASRFPHATFLDNERFAHSAHAMRDYFCDAVRFGLPEHNCLWLFDQAETPIDSFARIGTFVTDAMNRPKQQQPQDLIVYYIGHGFLDDNNYYLASHAHRNGEPDCSYRFRSLQRKIKDVASFLRKYYFIDACFSATAMKEMMPTSAVQKLFAEVRTESPDEIPSTGTALLAASPSDEFAFAKHRHHKYTMFTGTIIDVLSRTPTTQKLTLDQLYQQVRTSIREDFPEDGVLPEIHRPEQKHGDITTIPLFRGGGIKQNKSNQKNSTDIYCV